MAAATSGGKGFKGANTGPGSLKRVFMLPRNFRDYKRIL